VPERDATLAGLRFDDDATNNRTDVYRAGTRVLRLGADGSIGDVTGNLTGDVTGNVVTGTVTRKVREVTVTATQLRKLRATPVDLVPAVAGAIHIFLGMLVDVDIATAFDSVGAGEDLVVRYADDSGDIASAALDTTTDIDFTGTGLGKLAWVPAVSTVLPSSGFFQANEKLVLHNVGGGELAAADDDANGNATLTCTVIYLEIAV
jgi:hypothetical protein